MTRPRAALTGATGFLGIHLLPALVEAGFDVRILARRDPEPGIWQGLAFETVRGDLADAAALAALVQGADVVVHAAGLTKALRGAEFLRVNRDGTAALVNTITSTASGARFLLVSSLAAREPRLSDYAFSKNQAELAVQAAFAGSPEKLAIIRPPAIYGPWDKETLTVFRSTLRPFASIPGRGRTALIHAREAAAAIAALAKSWRAGRYALADARPEGYAMRDLLLAAARATGGKARIVQVPDQIFLAAGSAAGLWARLSGKPLIFGPGKAREMLHADWMVSAAELLPAEIFSPRLGLDAGFADTVAWYRHAGWL